jgi:SAM-dependent methyltransferase
MSRAPVDIGMLWPTEKQAQQAPVGEIALCHCHGCGFVFNRSFAPEKISYEPGFEASLHHSPVHRQFLVATAANLIERFELRNKNVIEVGCGSGFFLELLCNMGANQGVGFDPSITDLQSIGSGNGSVKLVRGTYGVQHSALAVDLLCCRSVLEHIHRPQHFVQAIRTICADRDVDAYFEIANGTYIFEQQIGWNIFYEQCSYFSEENLVDLFRRSGFSVLRSGTCFADGNYLFVDVTTRHAMTQATSTPIGDRQLSDTLRQFSRNYEDQLSIWTDRLTSWAGNQKRVAVWGAGGRGIMFVNALPTKTVSYVVDINPQRQGRFVAGSGQRVVPPAFMTEYSPDIIVIMNAVYEEEIRRAAANLNLTCEFVLA